MPPGEQGEAQDDSWGDGSDAVGFERTELYVLQINAGGLNPDDYERWLGDLLVAALIET